MSAMFSTTPSQSSSGCSDSLRQLDHLQRLLHALEREVLRLARDQRVIGGHQRVHGQQAERRRAVDQHQVVVALTSRSARLSVSSRPILPPSTSSASASPRLAGSTSS